MVVGAFPIAKLSILLVKQISKPIANACKIRAKNSPFFRTYVCMPPAQFYNWCEVKAKMWILNLGKPVNIPVLSQEMAIELGANLLGESVIFVIGAALLLFEYNRQINKENAKEVKREQEMNYITSTITELYFTVQKQQTQLREMERLVLGIQDTPTKKSEDPLKEPKKPVLSPPMPPSPPSATENNKTQNNKEHPSLTPYPDRGIILKSLNYIQMDVLSLSTLSSDNGDQMKVKHAHINSNNKRDAAVITEALHNIENNYRSLF